ncbi:MAG: radical SAM protein [Patescibacteria group bacterium]
MDKILFIVPPYPNFDSFVNPGFNERVVVKKSGNYGNVVTDMPMGLLSISAYLKKNAEVQTKLIDFNVILNKIDDFKYNSFSELFLEILSEKEWVNFNPDIIGISALFAPSYKNMLDVADISRKIFPNAIIIAGGGAASNMYKQIFKDSSAFDALCYGEGEKPILGLVKTSDKKEFLKSNPSWITKEKTGPFQYDFIENLDEIPFPDYDLLETGQSKLSPSIDTFTSFDNKKNYFPYSTSRGCPHKCCFCASHSIHGRKMRYHSLERLKEDFMRLKEQYGAQTIAFLDDNIMLDRKRALKIIDLAKELKLNIFFLTGLALYALDKEMLSAIKSAGVNEITLAIESGSDRVLKDVMHKPLTLSIIKQVVADCRALGIYTDANILIGLPGETKKDIEDTRLFLRNLDIAWIRIYIATPLVGSELFDLCIKNNYLTGDYTDSDFKNAVIETPDFTAEYIQEKAYSLNLEINFVQNSDFRLGNYAKALEGFENAMRIKNDHAFAYYFSAKCCKLLGLSEKYSVYKDKYKKIIEESKIWRNYAKQFNLPALV